jgi:hypothetical protein
MMAAVPQTKVLILHPEDGIAESESVAPYDLVIDLGRASPGTYERWSKQTRSQVICLYDFVAEDEDIYRTRSLLNLGRHSLIDRMGIDWWSVLWPEMLVPLQQLILVQRLAKYIDRECDLYSSRADYRCAALHLVLGGRITNLEGFFRASARRVGHYAEVASTFDLKQIFQIAQDKFDNKHALRSRLARRSPTSNRPSILLPSAYINVSRAALAYAASLPQEQFLLVCARDNAKVPQLFPNVQMTSLDPYFSRHDPHEARSLLELWGRLKMRLAGTAPEYKSGAAVGLLDRIPFMIRRGIAIRDAWKNLFDSENICSCFSADHNNVYTRIPLLLARRAGIPAVACHHGALDGGMAITTHDADFYLAKSQMERDYMIRVCDIAPEKVICCAPDRAEFIPRGRSFPNKSSMVFFSEPYSVWSWRMDEVYRDLLPRLYALAEECRVKLVVKLHPFESTGTYQQLLSTHLGTEKMRSVEIVDGAISEELWQNTRFALTAQSSIALECTARGIPIFLCGWLRDPFSGYIQQYQKFGIGRLVETVDQIAQIPELLASGTPQYPEPGHLPDSVNSEILKHLLSPCHALQDATG